MPKKSVVMQALMLWGGSVFWGLVFSVLEVADKSFSVWMPTFAGVGVYPAVLWIVFAKKRERYYADASKTLRRPRLRTMTIVFGIQAVVSSIAVGVLRDDAMMILLGLLLGAVVTGAIPLLWWAFREPMEKMGYHW